jgi:DNA-binding NtrC family response regulator
MTAKSPATILLLISGAQMRSILHETLDHAGYLVVTANDIGAAVDRLKEMRPDLLIIRPYISTMPGPEAAHYLRTFRPGLPVLIVAGFMDDERIRVQSAIEHYHVFPKPFAASELLDKVKEVLGGVARQAIAESR